MKVKFIVDEDFVNYKHPSLFIGTISCGGKCCIEANIPITICQNDSWRKNDIVTIDNTILCDRYINNPITKAIVIGGLEPFEQFDDMCLFIKTLRIDKKCLDDVVIYTGYNKDEIISEINSLKQFSNIIIKFGRYIPNVDNKYDDELGITLISYNQYGERIS